jgi:hypothetical protein
MREAGQFFKSVWASWIGKMSTSASVILTALTETGWVSDPNLKHLFWAVSVALIVWAFFLAWRTEHRARLKAEETVERAVDDKVRIDRLVARIAALEARRLSPTQQTQILQALNGVIGTITIISDVSVHDASGLADDFRDAFQRAGWTVSRSPAIQIRIPPPSGLAIEVMSTDIAKRMALKDPTDTRAILKGAFDAAGIQADSREFSGGWNATDACIIVGHRPAMNLMSAAEIEARIEKANRETVGRAIGAAMFYR